MNKKYTFNSLLITNFVGVLDDNLLKGLISLMAVYWICEGNESVVIMLAASFMVVPFILFSPYAGFLSKTLIKTKVVVFLKTAELFIMMLASVGFWLQNIYIVMIAMFLMGLQSTFFAPMKFALIRDIGGEEKSSLGTGLMEMTTFFGVLVGTFLAGVLTDLTEYRFLWINISFALITLLGLLNAKFIRADEPKPLTVVIKPLNFILYLRRRYRWSKKNVPGLNVVVVGLSIFWMIGSLLQLGLFIHCPITMGLTGKETGIVMALVAISIGIGSYLSGKISKECIRLDFVVFGAIIFAILNALIYFINPIGISFTILIMLTAFFAGFFKTPLNAWMQVNVKGRQLGDAIAYNNLVNFIFILISAGIFGYIETYFGSISIFLCVSIISLIMIVYLFIYLPGVKNLFKKN